MASHFALEASKETLNRYSQFALGASNRDVECPVISVISPWGGVTEASNAYTHFALGASKRIVKCAAAVFALESSNRNVKYPVISVISL